MRTTESTEKNQNKKFRQHSRCEIRESTPLCKCLLPVFSVHEYFIFNLFDRNEGLF